MNGSELSEDLHSLYLNSGKKTMYTDNYLELLLCCYKNYYNLEKLCY